MSRSTIFPLIAVLALSGLPATAQTMLNGPTATQTSPETATKPDNATSGIGDGDHTVRAPEGRAQNDDSSPPANSPVRDETVGVGGSVDVAPRDVREPFDE